MQRRTFVKVKTKSRHSKRELSPLGNCTCAIGDVLLREWGLTQTRVGTNSSSSPLIIQTIPNGMDSIRRTRVLRVESAVHGNRRNAVPALNVLKYLFSARIFRFN